MANQSSTTELGRQTAAGFAWLLLQTLSVKLATVVGQILLAWLLAPKDFGLIALAYSVVTFIAIFQSSGLREILIQREREFPVLAAPAFWLSLVIGTVVSAMIVGSAPWAARVYNQPELPGLLVVLAVFTFISNLENIPTAQLQNQMRFRALSTLGIFQGVSQISLSVILAALGFGAYSFLLPLPIIALIKVGVLWSLARPPLSWNFGLGYWPSLIKSSGLLIGASFFIGINVHGASIVLGLFHTAGVVGIFFFAYHLAQQVQTLLALNLAHVLLPSFSKLQENPIRQYTAFLRANKLLMILGAPASFLVAASADPGVRLVFDPRWIDAIPVVQALAIGTAFTITTIVTLSFLKAQGRYQFHLWISMFRALLFLGLVTAAAARGGALAVGIAAAIAMMIYSPSMMYASIRRAGLGWRHVWNVYAAPIGSGAFACGLAVAAANLVPATIAGENFVRVTVTIAVSGMLYVPFIWLTAREEWEDLLGRVMSFLPQKWQRVMSPLLLPLEKAPAKR